MNYTINVINKQVLCLLERMEIKMAKSKLIKANEKIAEVVVDSYKKIEKGVVGTYTKIEDKFVDEFLTKNGETVEEAKKRLKEEELERRNQK